MKQIDVRRARKPQHFKKRLLEDAEAKLFAACDALDQFDRTRMITKATLTQAQVDEIRTRVEQGEQQKDVATAFKISAASCSAIVNGKTWNPARRREPTRGKEMKRRLLAAFRAGPRSGEMLKTQIKHVEWNLLTIDGEQGYRITLPPEITKGGKTSGEDEHLYAMGSEFVQMLDARRLQLRRKNSAGKWEPNPEAFIFGTEAGHSLKRFTKSAKRLFQLAGLDWGRDKGIVWHLIKHEFSSRLWETTKDQDVTQELSRHKDFRTTKLYMTQREEAKLRAAAGLVKKGIYRQN